MAALSSFGSTPSAFAGFAQTQSSGAFGAQNQQNQPQQPNAFGTFGSQNQPNQPQQPNAFGTFGSQNQPNQPQQPNVFGAFTSQNQPNQRQQPSTSAPGASSNIFGTQSHPSAASGNDGNLSPNSSIEAQVRSVYEAWNPQSPHCRFQHFFHNLVDPAEVHKYTRPASATNDAIWQKAVRDNPNPSRLVPVLAVGFEDLKKRVQAQKSQAEAQLAGMQLLKKELSKMSETHTLRVQPRISVLSHTQVELTARLTKLIHHLHLFIPSVRSTSIRPDEEALRAQLEAIEAELRRPGGLGRVGGRIGELWGLIGRIRGQKETGRLGTDKEAGWAIVDGATFEDIKQILLQEQQGLKYLTEILRTALHDINLIRSGLGSLDLTASSST